LGITLAVCNLSAPGGNIQKMFGFIVPEGIKLAVQTTLLKLGFYEEHNAPLCTVHSRFSPYFATTCELVSA